MITSSSNGRIKWVTSLLEKAKIRRKEELFVAEGMKMFLEAPRELIREVYVSQDLLNASNDSELVLKTKEKLKEIPYEVVSSEVFRKMSDTVTPQGILSVLEFISYERKDLLTQSSPLLLVLENIQDPGNMGTIFRTAEGAGVNGIILSKDCVDIYNPKVIRSTMGSIYRVPFLVVNDLYEEMTKLQEEGMILYAAALKDSLEYDAFDYRLPTAFIIGNEGNGLLKETIAACDKTIRIPMEGRVESLNAGVAASILSYEAYRQRRNA